MNITFLTGNSRWVHAMEWSGQREFEAAATVPFIVDGVEAGQMKSHGPLTFLKVSTYLCHCAIICYFSA